MSNHTALIQDLFANITREGWSTKFNDALADDLVWVATGSSPVAGTYEGKQVYLEKIIKRLGVKGGVKIDHRGGEKIDQFLGS
jgi:ketosteroid isomerase-like protein